MDALTLIKNVEQPKGRVDVVLDTDTFNEIDDQYAIAYMLSSGDKICTKAICAAPFTGTEHSKSAADGMEKSYQEIHHILDLMHRDDMKPFVFRGSTEYLKDEKTPVVSPAAEYISQLAMNYTPENPLYVIEIGAITNIASAILLNPEIVDRIVVIFLGCHAMHWPDNYEFNLRQDVAAGRVVFDSGVPLVMVPCFGVVSSFAISEAELLYWLKGKNELCDYLVQHTVDEVTYAVGKPWTRVIWDVVAISWLTGDFTDSYIMPRPILEYDHHMSVDPTRAPARYIYNVKRDELCQDLFVKLSNL